MAPALDGPFQGGARGALVPRVSSFCIVDGSGEPRCFDNGKLTVFSTREAAEAEIKRHRDAMVSEGMEPDDEYIREGSKSD